MRLLQKKEKQRKKNKYCEFLKNYALEVHCTMWLNIGMWGTASGGQLYSKNHLVSYKQHEVANT